MPKRLGGMRGMEEGHDIIGDVVNLALQHRFNKEEWNRGRSGGGMSG